MPPKPIVAALAIAGLAFTWGRVRQHTIAARGPELGHTDATLRSAELARVRICAAAVLLLLAVAAPAGAAGQRRVALVIGNSAYASPLPSLANPRNDASLIARTLRSLGFTLVGGRALIDLDRAGFEAAIESFGRQIEGADVALFYYAGHGLQVHGVNWLVPVGANLPRMEDLDFQMIDAGLVLRQMTAAGTRLNIVILDACRNNPYSGRGFRGLQGGLAEMPVPKGTVISYATQPDMFALDGDGADSPFTAALADSMLQPGLGVFETFNRVGNMVEKETAADDPPQQPWLAISPIDGEFYFSGLPRSSAPPPLLPATLSPPPDPLDFSSLYAGSLSVWMSMSAESLGHERPILKAFHQDFPEFQLNSQVVPPDDFVGRWNAESGDRQPDVAFIDRFTQLRPLDQKDAVWGDWGHDRFGLNGWWVLSKHAPHLDAGRALLRWLAASPRWQPMAVRNASLAVPDMKAIEAKALDAVDALRSGDRLRLETLLDPEAARALDDALFTKFEVTSARPLQTFGNSRIAFTIIDVSGSSDRAYGLRHMAFILRKRDGEWRILQLDRDVNLGRIDTLFHAVDQLITSDGTLPAPPAPVLTEPADNAVLPLPPSRYPTLAWTSDARDPVSFLIEMQMNVMHTQASPPLNPGDLTDSYMAVATVAPGQASYRISAPFGVNGQPYRARIWAIDASGGLSLSDWHAMYFLYTQPSGAVMSPIAQQTDHFGGDYADFALPTAWICRQSCASDSRCRAFAFADDMRHCWLKDRVSAARYSSTIESGVKYPN